MKKEATSDREAPLLPISRSSLITATALRLRKEMERGRWEGILPAERNLAELLQVSRPTLRAALKNLDEEGVITRQGLRRKITCAHLPRSRARSGRIVLLSPASMEGLQSHVPLWINHLADALAARKEWLHFEIRPSCFSPKPETALRKLVNEVDADCWLLLLSNPAIQNWFARQPLRHLVIGSPFSESEVSSISIDQSAICRHAILQFIRSRHQHIALIAHRTQFAGDIDIRTAFLQACSESPTPPRTIIIEHDGTRNGVSRAVDRLLAMQQRPTAIFSVGAQQTATVLTRLLEKGVRLPDDISLISRDDHAILDYFSPTLARYRRDPHRHGLQIARSIRTLLTKPTDHRISIKVCPEFIEGATLGRRNCIP